MKKSRLSVYQRPIMLGVGDYELVAKSLLKELFDDDRAWEHGVYSIHVFV